MNRDFDPPKPPEETESTDSAADEETAPAPLETVDTGEWETKPEAEGDPETTPEPDDERADEPEEGAGSEVDPEAEVGSDVEPEEGAGSEVELEEGGSEVDPEAETAAAETTKPFGPRPVADEEPQPELPQEVLLSRLESLIFVAKEPITVRRLARILSLKGKRVRELLGVLDEHYRDRGIVLQEISGGFQFRTHPQNAKVVMELVKVKPLRLSRPALETLAIVAYRQPLTRADVEQIRGVDCGGVLRFLFEKGLVRVLGRKEEPGRPIIYGTGQPFLELFGLKSLSDLPALHEFSELWDEHRELVDQQEPEGEEPLNYDQTRAQGEPDDTSDTVEPTTETEPTEPAEPVEEAESAEPAEPSEGAEPAESTEPDEESERFEEGAAKPSIGEVSDD